MKRSGAVGGILVIVGIVVWWSLAPSWLDFLTAVAVAKGLVVLGVVLLIRAGLVSFGQGLFFAVGAYAVGFAGKWWSMHDALALAGLGLAAGIVVSLAIGLLVARYREIFFAMLTLAFSMMLYGGLVKGYGATGGSEGMPITPPTLLGRPFSSDTELFFFTLACASFMIVMALLYARSPLGYAAQAIRSNEIRVGYLGASVTKIVLATFILAGAASGLGGALDAMLVGHIDPDLTYWTTSGEFVFVALLSGTGSVVAPLVGTVIFEIVRSYALRWFPDFWQIALGGVLLAVVLFLPGGLWSLHERVLEYARRFARGNGSALEQAPARTRRQEL
ncbi:MAG: branched-chain amino acid ABC transporter permease [Thermoleophilia bacterium]